MVNDNNFVKIDKKSKVKTKNWCTDYVDLWHLKFQSNEVITNRRILCSVYQGVSIHLVVTVSDYLYYYVMFGI